MADPESHLQKDTGNFYKRMIEEIQDYAIIVLDNDGIIRNWNRGAEKIKGYTGEEVIGKHFSIFYFPEDIGRKVPYTLLEEARATGRAASEGWRKRKDGSRFWASIAITAIHNEAGEVVGFSKVTRDLTEKMMADEKLRMSEERYHLMIAEVQDYAIILLDEHGIVQNWNAGAEKIKGYRTEEIVGKSFETFYTKEDRESGTPLKLLGIAREHGKALHEGWRVRKDGTRFWGTIVITALHGRDGSIIGYSKVTRDLTNQKLAEERLNAYMRELEIQNRELEQFAFVASHDLQEPLRKIRTFAELIQERFDDRDFVKRYFSKLDNAARRMSELIRSLLDYSRISKGSLDRTSVADVDLNAVLADVKSDLELVIQEKNATILADVLPVVEGSRVQLGQLFSNLISNSLKFTERDPVVRITASQVNRGQIRESAGPLAFTAFHKISFIDNGIGFEQKYEKLIFSLFQRLHGKHDYAGTGIGLALCKKIAENHGGTITAESEPGKGATFSVYIPLNHSII